MVDEIRILEGSEDVDDGELQTEKKVKKARVMRCSIKTHNAQGEEVFNLETAVAICEKYKSIKRYAIILHDKCVYTSKDVVLYNRRHPENPRQVGDHKDNHIHIVLELGTSQYVDMVAGWFDIPANLMYVASGKGAFLDCVEYLTHEHPKQQELGKTLYPDEEVIANFDFRKALSERHQKREKYGRDDVSLKDMLRYEVAFNGMTLKQVREQYPFEYMADFEKLKKLQSDYNFNRPTPPYRLNIYIGGPNGGIGKGLFGKAFAKKMVDPCDLMDDEDVYFSVTKKTGFNKYRGQPVLLWEDFRAFELLDFFGDRGELFNYLNPYPAAGSGQADVKFDTIRLTNCINIFDSIQEPEVWLDGLAGEYTRKDGTHIESELGQKEQSYRRFPLAFWIIDDSYRIYINKGFLEGTREYTQFEISEKMEGNFQHLYSIFNHSQYRQSASLLIEPACEKALHIESIMKNNKPDKSEEDFQRLTKHLGKPIPEPEKYTTVEEALAGYQAYDDDYKLGQPVYSMDEDSHYAFYIQEETKAVHPVINGYPDYEDFYTAEELENLKNQDRESTEEMICQLQIEMALIEEFTRQWKKESLNNLRKGWEEKPHLRQSLFMHSFAPAFEKWQAKNKGNIVPVKDMLISEICFL